MPRSQALRRAAQPSASFPRKNSSAPRYRYSVPPGQPRAQRSDPVPRPAPAPCVTQHTPLPHRRAPAAARLQHFLCPATAAQPWSSRQTHPQDSPAPSGPCRARSTRRHSSGILPAPHPAAARPAPGPRSHPQSIRISPPTGAAQLPERAGAPAKDERQSRKRKPVRQRKTPAQRRKTSRPAG